MQKKKQSPDPQRNVTIVFGYALFIITLLVIIVSTVIPFSALLFSPTVRHANVIIALISLVAGAAAPLLIAYIIGDRATHVKNKASHHYNGVLFGITAYWLSLLFGFIGSESLASIRDTFAEPLATIVGSWPILATILVMTFVAVTYTHTQKHKNSVLQHLPYQLVLSSAVIATIVYAVAHIDYTASIFVLDSVLIAIPAILVVLSYKLLPIGKRSSSERLTSAVIAMSVGIITTTLSAQLISYLTPLYIASMLPSQIIGIVIWTIYVWLIRART